MKVGVPTEIKANEHRVGLSPAAVSEYVAAGHEVVVQSHAGSGIGAGDETYCAAGAIVADTAEEIFATADMIVKVKEPQASVSLYPNSSDIADSGHFGVILYP